MKKKYIAVGDKMEIAKLLNRLNNLAELIHYPKHWDTACYPTLESALHEIGCSECRGHQ